MNAKRLLEVYERISEAPDAIVRLRRFVLDLAVRGKLVEQDAADEPASDLLAKITSQKASLVERGILKPERAGKKAPAPVELFDLPRGWAWSTLQAVCLTVTDGDHQPPPKAEEGVPFLVIGDVRTKTINYNVERKVSPEYFDGLDPMRKPRTGDLLYTLVGSFGIPVPVLSDAPFCVQRHIGILRPAEQMNLSALALFMESQFAFTQAEAAATGIAQKTVSLAGLRAMVLPIPPLAEQHRIVAKVDELMALCDRLEEARKTREEVRDKLTAASLARLTAPDTTPEDFPTHAAFALEALPALTTRPDQIKTLRQTILNLAVRGKLVEQDPADEPASELLKAIAEERAELVRLGEVGKQKPLLPVEGPETPFSLPDSWTWCRLGSLVLASDAGWSPRTENHARVGDEWGVLKVSAVSWDHFAPEANKQVLPGTEPRLQAQVRKGDFLISRANTAELVARAVLVREEPKNLMMSDKIVRLRLASNCDHRFAWLVNNYSDYGRDYYAANATGVSPSMKNVSRAVILSLPLPLPPLAEQHRIMANVDALMALCDQLEAALTTADTTRTRLLEALLHDALEPAASIQKAAE